MAPRGKRRRGQAPSGNIPSTRTASVDEFPDIQDVISAKKARTSAVSQKSTATSASGVKTCDDAPVPMAGSDTQASTSRILPLTMHDSPYELIPGLKVELVETPRYMKTRHGGLQHPGVQAGLARRTRGQIQAVAQAKKDEAAAQLAVHQEQEQARDRIRFKNVETLALIMDKQAQEEEAAVRSFGECARLLLHASRARVSPAR